MYMYCATVLKKLNQQDHNLGQGLQSLKIPIKHLSLSPNDYIQDLSCSTVSITSWIDE